MQTKAPESFDVVVKKLIAETTPPLAKHLDEAEQAVAAGLETSVAMLARAMTMREQDPAFGDSLIEFIELQRRADASGEDASFLSRASALVGDGFLEELFGDDYVAPTQSLAHSAKLRSGSASRVLSVAANVLLKSLEPEPEAAPVEAIPMPPKTRSKHWLFFALAASLALAAGLNWRMNENVAARRVAAVDAEAPKGETAPARIVKIDEPPQVAAPPQPVATVAAPHEPAPAQQTAALATPEAAQTPPPSADKTTLDDGLIRKKLRTGVELTLLPFSAEDRLLRALEHPPATGAEITLEQISFPTGRAQPEPAGLGQLRNIAEIMKAYPRLKIAIKSYTDPDGDRNFNARISKERAKSVQRELVGAGVDAGRMSIEGLGAAHAVAADPSVANRLGSRRVSLGITGM